MVDSLEILLQDKIKTQQLRDYLDDALRSQATADCIDLSKKTDLWYATLVQSGLYADISSESMESINKIIPSLRTSFQTPVGDCMVTDWGSGNGAKGILVYQLLKSRGRLFQVDCSPGLLDIARRAAEAQGIEVRTFQCNLEHSRQIFSKEQQSNPQVHLLLGQTLGNTETPEKMLETIATSMNLGGYLLVEVFNRDHGQYATAEDQAFVTSYIQALGISKEYFTNSDGKVDWFVSPAAEILQKHSQNALRNPTDDWLYGGVRLHHDFKHDNGTVVKRGTTLVAMRTRQFKELKGLISLAQKCGLEPQPVHYTAVHKNGEEIDFGGDATAAFQFVGDNATEIVGEWSVPHDYSLKTAEWLDESFSRFLLLQKKEEFVPLWIKKRDSRRKNALGIAAVVIAALWPAYHLAEKITENSVRETYESQVRIGHRESIFSPELGAFVEVSDDPKWGVQYTSEWLQTALESRGLSNVTIGHDKMTMTQQYKDGSSRISIPYEHDLIPLAVARTWPSGPYVSLEALFINTFYGRQTSLQKELKVPFVEWEEAVEFVDHFQLFREYTLQRNPIPQPAATCEGFQYGSNKDNSQNQTMSRVATLDAFFPPGYANFQWEGKNFVWTSITRDSQAEYGQEPGIVVEKTTINPASLCLQGMIVSWGGYPFHKPRIYFSNVSIARTIYSLAGTATTTVTNYVTPVARELFLARDHEAFNAYNGLSQLAVKYNTPLEGAHQGEVMPLPTEKD